MSIEQRLTRLEASQRSIIKQLNRNTNEIKMLKVAPVPQPQKPVEDVKTE